MLQHLLDQVVDDVPVVPGEPGDEAADVVAPLDRERSKLKRGNPPLRSLLQSREVLRGEVQSGNLVEVRGGLVGREAQIRSTDLDQLPVRAPTRQWQIGVDARADHHVHVWRKVLQQEGHPIADIATVNVVVVEH
jgi:hypothetical protein